MEYKNQTTAMVVQYIQKKYNEKPEFLWANTPQDAAIRHSDTRKWFAVLLMNMPKNKLGLQEEGSVDIIDLKCNPELIGALIDGKSYLPGYHMNKEHWITVVLDGKLSIQKLYDLIDLSYELTENKKTPKKDKISTENG